MVDLYWIPYLIPIVAALLLVAVSSYFDMRNKSQEELASYTKEKAYQLFLYAEKQDWLGPYKMNWVAVRLHDMIPSKTIQKVIGEDKIRDWLQSLYDEFKATLKD